MNSAAAEPIRSPETNTPKRGVFRIRDAGPFNVLVQRLQGFVDRPLIDDTGLTGNFDWVISFSNDPLELEKRTAPYQIRVVDSVDMATPN